MTPFSMIIGDFLLAFRSKFVPSLYHFRDTCQKSRTSRVFNDLVEGDLSDTWLEKMKIVKLPGAEKV